MSSSNSDFSETALSQAILDFELLPESESESNKDKYDESKYKEQATGIIRQYFKTGEIDDLIYSVEGLGIAEYNPIFVKKLITLAMEQNNKAKEMASVLISALTMGIFTTDDIMAGFTMLLDSVDDTMLDIPDASDQLSLFLARAVIDDVFAPIHLQVLGATFPLIVTDTASKTIVMASKLAFSPHGGERLERCWGSTSDGSLKTAKEKVVNILKEYQSGWDLREACRCIREIGMSFFNHEVVKEALIMAMESKTTERMLALLQECHQEVIITENQMLKGFQRVKDLLHDLVLDIPKSPEIFYRIVKHAEKNAWLGCFNLVENKSTAN